MGLRRFAVVHQAHCCCSCQQGSITPVNLVPRAFPLKEHTMIAKEYRSSVMDTIVRRGADVGSDHYIVETGLKLKLKKSPREKKGRTRIDMHTLTPGEGGGRGTQIRFIRGGPAPRSSTLPFYIPFFQKRHPFYWKKVPLSYTFLRRLIDKSLKQEVFLSFFHVARNK